jgi:hypothetical protein
MVSILLLLAATAAKADLLTLTLSSPFQTINESGVVTFDATVINNTGQLVYLNGDSSSVDSPLIVDDSPYNTNFPLSLAAGDSFTGELFAVDVPPKHHVAFTPERSRSRVATVVQTRT